MSAGTNLKDSSKSFQTSSGGNKEDEYSGQTDLILILEMNLWSDFFLKLQERGVCQRKDEGGYAFALTLLAVHGTLEINFPLWSYRSNTILFFSRIYFDEVFAISLFTFESLRSTGMLVGGL